MASQTERNKPSRELPTTPEITETAGAHRTPAPIHRVRAGQVSRGVTTPVPRVYLSVSLTGPDPSGSPEPTRLCRGCSHLPRRSPDRLPPASPHRHDGRAPKVSHLRPTQPRLVAHAAVSDLHVLLAPELDHHPRRGAPWSLRVQVSNSSNSRPNAATSTSRAGWPTAGTRPPRATGRVHH